MSRNTNIPRPLKLCTIFDCVRSSVRPCVVRINFVRPCAVVCTSVQDRVRPSKISVHDVRPCPTVCGDVRLCVTVSDRVRPSPSVCEREVAIW